MAVLSVMGIFLLAGLVGHLFYRALAPQEERASWSEVLFIQLMTGVLLVGWSALVLAELRIFSLVRVAVVLVVACVVVVVLRWPYVRRWRWPRFHLGKHGRIVLALFVGLAVLLAWPGEPILGGNDPGVYVAVAASVARTGSIVVHDPLLPQVPPEVREPLFADRDGLWWQLPGLYITDWSQGEVTPQFLHLYPTWLALFYAAGGLDAALVSIAFFTLLGLAALYFLARRVVGWPAAPLAVALLALNPAVIWYAREAVSETLVVVLLVGGWYLLDRAIKEPGRYDLAVLAGLALGQIGLTKIELLFLPLLLYGYFFLRSTQGKLPGPEKAFLLTYSLLCAHALLHMGSVARPYLRTSVLALGRSGLPFFSPVGLSLIGVGTAVAVLGLLLARRPIGRLVAGANARVDRLRGAAAALWLGLVGYGAFVWPALAPRWVEYEGQIYTNYNRLLFLRLSWYLSLPGLILAVLGLWYWTRRRLDGPALPFFLALLLEMGLYTHRAMDYAYQFWIARRYLPVIFPFLAIGLGAALQRVRFAPLGPTVRRAGLALLLGLLVFLSVQADAPFVARREMLGLRRSLEDLAAQVPDDRPLFVADFGAGLATPMRYIEDKAAYALPESKPWEAYWQLLHSWPAGEDTTYLLAAAPPPVLHGGFALVESGLFALDVVRTQQTLDWLPRDPEYARFPLRLLRVQRRPDVPTSLQLALASPEWMPRCLVVDLPTPSRPLTVRLTAAGFRPAELPVAHMQVYWDGRLTAETTLERTFDLREVQLRLAPPPDWVDDRGAVRLELCVPTWNPKAVGYNDDVRDLGMLLQSLQIEESP